MTTKPVWHDEIKTVHYHKLTNELIPGEQPTLHGTTDDETNKLQIAFKFVPTVSDPDINADVPVIAPAVKVPETFKFPDDAKLPGTFKLDSTVEPAILKFARLFELPSYIAYVPY